MGNDLIICNKAIWEAIMDDYSIEALGRMLKEKGMEMETAVNTSLRVRKGDKRERLMRWVEANPQVTVNDILEKSRELQKEKGAEQIR